MTREIEGMPDELVELVERLAKQIADHRADNELRSRYMSGHALLNRMPFVRDRAQLEAVVGWPAKAVETLAQRVRFERFTTPEPTSDLDQLAAALRRAQFARRVNMGELSAFVHGVSFEVAGVDAAGRPKVTHVSALNGTGDYDEVEGKLVNFLAVSEWDTQDSAVPAAFTLYLPGQVWTVIDGAAVVRSSPIVDGVPVEPLIYKPDLDRPLGRSRITWPVIFYTQSAMRVIVRSEATADLYSAPSLIALGVDSQQLQDGSWMQGIGNVVGIPDSDPADAPENAPNLARAQIEKIQQASQEPHIKQLHAWAQLFAGETSIPVSSLGISVEQANPNSAEAYAASREDLISNAEDAMAEFGAAHVRTVRSAWQLANRTSEPAEFLAGLSARYRDPRVTSQAARADAFVKLVGAMPALAQTDAALDMLGLDPELTERLRSDMRRSRATANILSLSRLAEDASGSVA